MPTYSKAIDTVQRSTDEISGIYHAGTDKIVVQKENDSTWYGITLKSNSKEWTKRKIRLRIHKTADGNFELSEYYLNGFLFYQKNIEISGGSIKVIGFVFLTFSPLFRRRSKYSLWYSCIFQPLFCE